MKLVFLYGLPATGKLTVAEELAKRTGWPLFHNHRVVDLLLPIFPFGSAGFVALREEIWLSVFAEAARANGPGLIFTFAPETSVRPDFPERAASTVAKESGDTIFIELICAKDVLRARLGDASRHAHGKLVSAAQFDQLDAAGAFAYPMPKPALSLDTGRMAPDEAARRIAALL